MWSRRLLAWCTLVSALFSCCKQGKATVSGFALVASEDGQEEDETPYQAACVCRTEGLNLTAAEQKEADARCFRPFQGECAANYCWGEYYQCTMVNVTAATAPPARPQKPLPSTILVGGVRRELRIQNVPFVPRRCVARCVGIARQQQQQRRASRKKKKQQQRRRQRQRARKRLRQKGALRRPCKGIDSLPERLQYWNTELRLTPRPDGKPPFFTALYIVLAAELNVEARVNTSAREMVLTATDSDDFSDLNLFVKTMGFEVPDPPSLPPEELFPTTLPDVEEVQMWTRSLNNNTGVYLLEDTSQEVIYTVRRLPEELRCEGRGLLSADPGRSPGEERPGGGTTAVDAASQEEEVTGSP